MHTPECICLIASASLEYQGSIRYSKAQRSVYWAVTGGREADPMRPLTSTLFSSEGSCSSEAQCMVAGLGKDSL